MSFLVRKAVLADYDGICAVLDEVDQLHRERFPDQFRKAPDGVVRPPAYVAALLADPNACLLVAEQDGEIIGVLDAVLRDTPPISILVPRRFAIVSDVVVRHNQRRQGVARALMQHAETWARSNGAESVELTVYAFNQGAIDFYQDLGYKSITYKMEKKL